MQKSIDLTSYKGTSVTLKFAATEDSSLQTSFVIDDVATSSLTGPSQSTDHGHVCR